MPEERNIGKRSYLLVFLAVFFAAFLLRAVFVDYSEGRRFANADALDYVASAQALAESGQYRVQIVEHSLHPRYPPGWPLLLSVAIRAGVPFHFLVLVNPFLESFLAAFLAIATLLIARRALRTGHREALVAASIAGLAWAMSPISIDEARQMLSDSSAALFAILSLFLAVGGFLAGRERQGRNAWQRTLLFLSGAAAMQSAACRVIDLYLLLPPLWLLFLCARRREGWRHAGAGLIALASGAGTVAFGYALLLLHSGFGPFDWTAYKFWDPIHRDMSQNLNLQHAITGSEVLPFRFAGQAIGHAELYLRLLFGFLEDGPGSSATNVGIGLYWPILAPFAAILLFERLRRRKGYRLRTFYCGLAFLVWLLGNFTFYALYFYPQPRYMLGVLPLYMICIGLGIARLIRSRRIVFRASGFLVLLAVFLSLGLGLRNQLCIASHAPHPENEELRALFAAHEALPKEEREKRLLTFDPQRAQALGLYREERLRQRGGWGLLPPTRQRPTLAANGLLPDFSEEWTEPLVKRAPASWAPQAASRSTLPDFRMGASHCTFIARDAHGELAQQYRVEWDTTGIRVFGGADRTLLLRWSRADSTPLATPRVNLYHRALVFRFGPDAPKSESAIFLSGTSLVVHERTLDRREHAVTYGPENATDFPIAGLEPRFVQRLLNGSFASWIEDPYVPVRWAKDRRYFLTLSSTLTDCLPVIDRATSPYRASEDRSFVSGPRAVVAAILKEARALGLPIVTEEADLTRLPPSADHLDPLFLVPLHYVMDPPLRGPGAWMRRGLAPSFAAVLVRPGRRLQDKLFALAREAATAVDRGAIAVVPTTRSSDLESVIAMHYLFEGVRSELGAATAGRSVYFDNDGRSYSLERALARGFVPDRMPRRSRWSTGLEFYCNPDRTPFSVKWKGERFALRKGDFLVTSPSGLFAGVLSGETRGAASRLFAINPGRSVLGRVEGAAQLPRVVQEKLSGFSDRERRATCVLDEARATRVSVAGELLSKRPLTPGPAWQRLEILGSFERHMGLGHAAIGLATVARTASGALCYSPPGLAWMSSNPDVASVDTRGIVRIHGPGDCAISARRGRLEAVVRVVVTQDPRVLRYEVQGPAQDRALVSFATDVRVPKAVLLVRREGNVVWRPVDARTSPSGKQHTVDLTGLLPGFSYEVQTLVRSSLGFRSLTPQPILETKGR